MGFNLDDKLINGINITNQKNRRLKRNKKPKKTIEVIADFDGIATRWPFYKAGTVVFKDHPSVPGTWLWIVDIGDLPVLDFMNMFRLKNCCSAIRIVPEVRCYKSNPSIIDAWVSKHSVDCLGDYPEYKQCHEFITREFGLLISQSLQKG